MRVVEALTGVKRLFVDTAPLIYYIEEHPDYLDLVDIVFGEIDAGRIVAVTSPVTLAECLFVPIRDGKQTLQEAFIEIVTGGPSTFFQLLDAESGVQAATLRAKYGLKLPDALQVAAALVAKCDGFLTNDIQLKRVTELKIIVLKDLSA